MASWTWPHTPGSSWACLRLLGGPFDGEEAGFVPPDAGAPVQVVWSGWAPWGFDAWLYEWHGETTTDRGRTEALIFRPTGRRIPADDIPPAVAETVELVADNVEAISRAYDVPMEALFPGL